MTNPHPNSQDPPERLRLPYFVVRRQSPLLMPEELILERRFEVLRERMKDAMPEHPVILLATANEGKVREFRMLFKDLPVRLVGLRDAHVTEEIEETGATFEANARLKAETYARLSGLWALADDSGLEVDALGGEPGVRSRRYAGTDATDAQLVQYLLRKLRGVPVERRQARFRSVIAIASPEGVQHMVEGECRGVIAFEPRGTEGFGYDPIFYLPEKGKTLAELPLNEKNQVSHRGRAAVRAIAALAELIHSRQIL
jgi:XTP/dITP diphosphohydrolase